MHKTNNHFPVEHLYWKENEEVWLQEILVCPGGRIKHQPQVVHLSTLFVKTPSDRDSG